MDPSQLSFLQNVLRYSASHSDGTAESSQTREMSPERKEWLEKALGSMSVNPVDEMKKCIKCLNEEENLEKQIEALETLRDWCEDLNFAIDFHKINGYSLLPRILNHESAEMRALACDLIGICAQNNPYCQETLIDSKILPLLLFKLDKDTDDVKIKALFAISSLTRDFEKGQKKLLEGNCLDIIIRSLKSPVEKLKTKTCFFCSSISNNSEIKKQLTNKKIMETLIELYRENESNVHEHLISTINALIESNPQAVKQAKNMKDVDFKEIINKRLETIQNDPRFNEEREMTQKIFQDFFQN